MRFLDFIKQIEAEKYIYEESNIVNDNLLLEKFGVDIPPVKDIPIEVSKFIENNLDLHTWSKHAKEAVMHRYNPKHMANSLKHVLTPNDATYIRNNHGWYDYIISNNLLKDLPIKVFGYNDSTKKYYACTIYKNLPVCLAINKVPSPNDIIDIINGTKQTDIGRNNRIEIFSGYAMSIDMLKQFNEKVPNANLFEWFKTHLVEQTDADMKKYGNLQALGEIQPPRVNYPDNFKVDSITNTEWTIDTKKYIVFNAPIFTSRNVIRNIVNKAFLNTFSNNPDYIIKINKLFNQPLFNSFISYLYNLGMLAIKIKNTDDITDYEAIKTTFMTTNNLIKTHTNFITELEKAKNHYIDSYLYTIIDRYSKLFENYVIKIRINNYIIDHKLEVELLDNPVPNIDPIKTINLKSNIMPIKPIIKEQPVEQINKQEVQNQEDKNTILKSPMAQRLKTVVKQIYNQLVLAGKAKAKNDLTNQLSKKLLIICTKLLTIIYNSNKQDFTKLPEYKDLYMQYTKEIQKQSNSNIQASIARAFKHIKILITQHNFTL